MDLVLASSNLHKIREFKEMFKAFKRIELLSLLNFPHYKPPFENGSCFKENALQKAEMAARTLNKWVLADDSGLVVPSLGGAPGVHSSYYAGEGATDSENRNKLLSALSNKQDFERIAYFECCLAVASPSGVQKCVTARCEGAVVTEPRGRYGFGYDSLFVKNDYDKTFAELDTIKNRISHRSKALAKLFNFLETLG